MEALGVVSSVTTVVDLSAKVVSLCLQYSKEVKHATDSIDRLRNQVNDLNVASASLHQMLNAPSGSSLRVSQQVRGAINDSILQLKQLHETLRPKTARQAMSRLGIRSLKWPFECKDVETSMQNLRQYTQTMSLALQIDSTNVLFNVEQTIVLGRLRIAEGASFDSYAQEHDSFCLPNTRAEILQKITIWAKDKRAEPIFWLNGMAGTGKSTISRTVARLLTDEGLLGASFFFKKGEAERGNLSKFFMTIAADLMVRKPYIAPHIKDILDVDRSIIIKNAGEQFDKFLLQPLSRTATEETPIIIIIDALDECERDDDIKLVLRLFSRFEIELPGRIRILLTSRPELPVRCGFKKIQDTYQDVILHEIPRPMIERDISLFLTHELARIREDYNDSVAADQCLASDWPGQSKIDSLLKMSVPLFIVATTICRFICDRKVATPMKQLEKVLALAEDGVLQLEGTYRSVLDNLTAALSVRQQEQILKEFRKVVGSIIVLASPLSTSALAKILGMSRDDIDGRLALLHSVLSIPSSAEAPVRLLHLSFRDYLINPMEPTMPFRVNEKQTHADLAAQCLRVLYCLKQDICDIRAPGTPYSTITTKKIQTCIPLEAQYACLYWVHHLEKADIYISDGVDASTFLMQHFLHWMEALALLGMAPESLGFLRTLQSRLENQNSTEISLFLEDATRFVRTHMAAISLTPLQIYSSLLIFAPKNSKVRTTFEDSKNKARWVCLKPHMEDNWSQCLQTFEGHSEWVQSVVFSHDSVLVASASVDKTVRIWRANTGECVQTLEGHSDGVQSVAFSHDSVLVASASRDTTVRIWLVDTGKSIQILNGHSDWVWSVVFSHDSTLVASASDDKIVQIWRTSTGECVQTLEGHRDGVQSVAFSNDSALVASASIDKAMRIWRRTTGECIRTLEGHSGWVRSVAFSHDSVLVASASDDKTVRIWRANSGECVQILKGHSDEIRSVAFSNDSALVASASIDNTMRIWRANTGKCVQLLRGHSGGVRSVVFSHDSALVASASIDKTTRIWRVNIGGGVQTLEGHRSWIRSVAFSHDSVLVASASDDKTVRIWCTNTGECVRTLGGHSFLVLAVVFSYDSVLVASASIDKTVRIWRTNSGECVQILKGHSSFVQSVAFSHDSVLVASASDDKTVRIWRASTGECLQTLEGHSGFVQSVAFSHDSILVASASRDTTVRIWRRDTGECMRTLEGHSGWVQSVAFSHDSSLVASASRDTTARIWRTDTGECKQTAKIGCISWCLSFNKNSSQILTGVGTIANKYGRLAEVPIPAEPFGIGISKDGCWITWNGKNLVWLPVEFRPICAAISESTVVIGSEAGKVAIIRLSPDCLHDV